MSVAEYVRSLPIVENHAHPVTPLDPDTTLAEFASLFSEGPPSDHARTTMLYRAELRLLADRFSGTDETELVAQRLDVDLKRYTRDLIDEAEIRAIVTDTGFPPDSTATGFQEYTDAAVHPLLRIETLIEELLAEATRFRDFITTYEERLRSALAGEFVGLKSIVAYRSGLKVTAPERAHARAAFEDTIQEWTGRIDEPALLDFLVERAATVAEDVGVPMQFHTGFGDNDAHAMEIDPGLLWDLIKRHPDLPVVLLHAGYPHVRKAGYMASVLPNVHVDFGMTVPFVQHGTEQLLEQLFELAPTSKLLYSSDSLIVPEWYYLGAERVRTALSIVLDRLIERGFLDDDQARTIATDLLSRNAEQLYDLPTTAD